MSPEARLNSLVIGITVSLMIIVIKALPTSVVPSNIIEVIVSLIVSIMTSAGVYLILVKLLSFLFLKLKIAKRFLLGSFYMEGTWIGSLKENQEIRYAVIYIEQKLDISSIIMQGKNFYPNGDIYTIWNSDAVSLNDNSGTLLYSYSCMIKPRGITMHGCGRLYIKRKAPNKPPFEINGFTFNFDGMIREVKEIKVSDYFIDEYQALRKAEEYVRRGSLLPLTRDT